MRDSVMQDTSESLQRKFSLIPFIYNFMIEPSKKN